MRIEGKSGDWLTTTNQRLPPFAGQEVVTSSESHDLPDLFPLSPLIDFEKTHIWRDENFTGKKDFSSKLKIIKDTN